MMSFLSNSDGTDFCNIGGIEMINSVEVPVDWDFDDHWSSFDLVNCFDDVVDRFDDVVDRFDDMVDHWFYSFIDVMMVMNYQIIFAVTVWKIFLCVFQCLCYLAN